MATNKVRLRVDLPDGKTISFTVPLFDDKEFANVEKYLKIDITNLPGELVVNPLIMNRFGILLAEAENSTSLEKMNYEIWEAKEISRFRKKRADDGEKNPTKPEIDEHITLHPLRPKKWGAYLDAVKNESYIKSTYWSFKEKQENLKKLSLTLQAGDLDANVMQDAITHLDYITGKKVEG